MAASSTSFSEPASDPSPDPDSSFLGAGNVILLCPLPPPTFSAAQLSLAISHELKTPLTGIMSLAQVQQHHPSSLLTQERRYADLLYQKSQQLLVAVNDLLDLTQLCTQHFVLQVRPIDLSEMLGAALRTAQQIVGLEEVSVPEIAQVKDKPEYWLAGDEVQLTQLFTHLWCFLLRPDTVQPSLRLSLHPQTTWLTLTFAMRTLRLSAAEQNELRNACSGSQVNVLGCSSLALQFLLARHLALLQGGKISWHSAAKEGTTLTIKLPRDLTGILSRAQRLQTQVDEKKHSPETKSAQNRPLTLLHLEDRTSTIAPESRVLELLALLSHHYGCSILAVNDLRQTELLAQIWQAKVMICLSTVPSWLQQVSEPSLITELPLFVLGGTEADFLSLELFRKQVIYPVPSPISAPISARGMSLKEEVAHLYQQLVDAAQSIS
jgi:hypothetical protein